jgi:hypothetical protein
VEIALILRLNARSGCQLRLIQTNRPQIVFLCSCAYFLSLSVNLSVIPGCAKKTKRQAKIERNTERKRKFQQPEQPISLFCISENIVMSFVQYG